MYNYTCTHTHVHVHVQLNHTQTTCTSICICTCTCTCTYTVQCHVHIHFFVLHQTGRRMKEPAHTCIYMYMYIVYVHLYLTPLALRDIHSGGGRALLTTVLKCSSHGAEHNIVCEGERERGREGCCVTYILHTVNPVSKQPFSRTEARSYREQC